MRLFKFLLLFDQNWRCRRWRLGRRLYGFSRRLGQMAVRKSTLDQIDKLRMLDIAGRRYNQVVRRKLGGVKGRGLFMIEGSNCFFGTLDRATQRLLWEICAVEKF